MVVGELCYGLRCQIVKPKLGLWPLDDSFGLVWLVNAKMYLILPDCAPALSRTTS